MNVQDQIIALLQGDLSDESQVGELIKQLAASGENRRLLMDYIALNQRYENLVGNIIVAPGLRNRLWNRIHTFESGSVVVPHDSVRSSSSVARGAWAYRGVIISLIALLGGVCIGYWLGESASNVVTNNVQETVPVQPKTSADIPQQVIAKHQEPLSDTVAHHSVRTAPLRVFSETSGVTDALPSATLVQDTIIAKKEPEALAVVTPNGGERFTLGSTVPIIWEGDTAKPVIVECSIDGGNSWLEINAAEDGKKTLWQIPENVGASDNCLLRIANEDLTTLRPFLERTFLGHDSGASVAEISPDGKLLATVGADTKVLFWDIQTGRLLRSMKGHTGFVTFAKFNRDGSKFASSSRYSSSLLSQVT